MYLQMALVSVNLYMTHEIDTHLLIKRVCVCYQTKELKGGTMELLRVVHTLAECRLLTPTGNRFSSTCSIWDLLIYADLNATITFFSICEKKIAGCLWNIFLLINHELTFITFQGCRVIKNHYLLTCFRDLDNNSQI